LVLYATRQLERQGILLQRQEQLIRELFVDNKKQLEFVRELIKDEQEHWELVKSAVGRRDLVILLLLLVILVVVPGEWGVLR